MQVYLFITLIVKPRAAAVVVAQVSHPDKVVLVFFLELHMQTYKQAVATHSAKVVMVAMVLVTIQAVMVVV